MSLWDVPAFLSHPQYSVLRRQNLAAIKRFYVCVGDLNSGPHAGDLNSGPHARDLNSGPHAGDSDSGPHAEDPDSGPHAGDLNSGLHAEDPNSGPHACTKSALTTEASHQPPDTAGFSVLFLQFL